MHLEILTNRQNELLPLVGSLSWKDYVNLFFLLKYHFDLHALEAKAVELFPEAFSSKLFRQQLAYFNDIDYTEKVDFISDNFTNDEINAFLLNQATITI